MNKQRTAILLLSIVGIITTFLPFVSVSFLGKSVSADSYHLDKGDFQPGHVFIISYLICGLIAIVGNTSQKLRMKSLAIIIILSLINIALFIACFNYFGDKTDIGLILAILTSILIILFGIFSNSKQKEVTKPIIPNVNKDDSIEKIEKLWSLKEKGVISEQEFLIEKNKILGNSNISKEPTIIDKNIDIKEIKQVNTIIEPTVNKEEIKNATNNYTNPLLLNKKKKNKRKYILIGIIIIIVICISLVIIYYINENSEIVGNNKINETHISVNNNNTTEKLDNTVINNIDNKIKDTLTITGKKVNIRKSPNLDSPVLFQLNMNDVCILKSKGNYETINNDSDYWYNIEYSGKIGWVFGKFTSKSINK